MRAERETTVMAGVTDPHAGPGIDPALLQRLKGIELKSRFLVRGLYNSRHRTSDFGSSTEFVEHRDYRRGDEPRQIDWRVFGRTNRYVVKVHEMEANMRVYLMLDTSESMRVPPQAGRTGKLELASTIAGAVAMMASAQQDAVGLYCIGEKIEQRVPARQGEQHRHEILRHLEAPLGGGGGAFGRRLLEAGAEAGTRCMVFALTDALDSLDELSAALLRLRERLQDVTLVRVFDRRELDFPFEQMTEFRHPETNERVVGNPVVLRERYLRRLEEHREQVRGICKKAQASLLEVDTAGDLSTLLTLHFIRRLMEGTARC
jgi:uncharacterized protein (DUF58 family)